MDHGRRARDVQQRGHHRRDEKAVPQPGCGNIKRKGKPPASGNFPRTFRDTAAALVSNRTSRAGAGAIGPIAGFLRGDLLNAVFFFILHDAREKLEA